jgi:Raf kinase inhibitor-like YbhB/YbcL family protein
MTLAITSPAFSADGAIPKRYTCDGEDLSPPLAFTGLPAGTASLVLIIEDPDAPDPDAPRTIWVHWIVYNIPPTTRALAEDAARRGLPPGALAGRNDWDRTGYGGPCPPVGRHRYVHRLLALDVVLPDLKGPKRAALEQACAGHVLEAATLVARYARAPNAR